MSVCNINKLSPRENEILKLLSEGLRDKETAKQLCISTHTIKNHIERMCYKLAADNRPHAVAIGFRVGILK